MSTTATPDTTPGAISGATSAALIGAGHQPGARGGTTSFWHVARSEWTKLWSLRSTTATLLVMVAGTLGFSAVASWGTSANLKSAATLDPTNTALSGVLVGQLALAVLGVLVISGEYSTGGIRSSLTAVPQRGRLVLAKAVVFAVVGLVVGLVTSFASFYLGMSFFTAHHVGVGIGDPQVLRAVIGAALYMSACGLTGYTIGLILRSSAAAITVSVALLFIVPLVLSGISAHLVHTINKYYLNSSGRNITQVIPARGALTPWHGYLIFTLEWTLLLTAGVILIKRRDAS